jgi:hypothetical protein
MQDLPLQGSIPDVFLPRLIARLHRAGYEGTLRVVSGGITKVFYFRRGEIASAASNADSDRLANILIRDGRLTAEQLDLAKSRLEPGGSLGRTLIEMGFLTPGELLQGARRQVRAILASCFALRGGTFQTEPGPLPNEVTALGIPTRRLIFDCVVEMTDRGMVVGEIGSMESVYRPTADLPPLLDGLKLDPETERLARSLDGLLTLGDLSARTRLDDFAVSKIVLALEILGLAEALSVPEPAGRPVPVADGGEFAPSPMPAAIPIAAEEESAADEPLQDLAVASGTEAAPSPSVPDESDEDAFVLDLEADAPGEGSGGGATAVPEERHQGLPPGVGLTPPPPAEAAPPPIPAGELPAFARPPNGPQWQIDPETGEKVHLGPVEVTFDGRVAAAPAEGPSRILLLLTAAGTLLVLGSLAAFIMLRRGGEDRPPARAAARVPPPAAPAAGPAPSGPQAAARVAEPDPPAPQPAAPAPETTRPEPPALRSAEPAPVPDGAAAPPPAATEAFFPAAQRDAALQALDEGDAALGARLFEDLVREQPGGRLTLQVMIACQDETVRKARSAVGSATPLFYLPYAFRDRSCYRLCWGLYDTRDAAEAASAGVPAALLGPGGRPVPVTLARLLPGS